MAQEDVVDMDETGESTLKSYRKISKDSYAIIQELKEHVRKMKINIPEMDYPQIEDEPIDEYTVPYMFADAYPWLFPGGIGDSTGDADGSELTRWAEMMLLYDDGRFMRDNVFIFHLMNYIQRHKNNQSGLYFLKEFIADKDISLQDIKEQIERGDTSFIERLQTFAGQKLKGSDAFWRYKKRELDSWIMHHIEQGHGPPTLFLTLSCAELWWPDLERLLYERSLGTEDEKFAMQMKHGKKDKERIRAKRKLLEIYSAVVQEFFIMRVNNWLETIGRDAFQIKHCYVRFEFAKGRGQVHAHMLAITKDNGISFEFYKEFFRNKNAENRGTELLSEYARNQLCLTSDKPIRSLPLTEHDVKALKKGFCEISSIQDDLVDLCDECHCHTCNDFCLRTPKGR
jgi:hypothetical protein